MLFDIQTDSAVPIYEQILAQMIYNIAAGNPPPGELLPLSVRDLAQKLMVNPNTVARAVAELERRGIVTARRGMGMEVTPRGPALCRKQREDIVRQRVRAALREGALALPADDLRGLVEEELVRTNGKARRPDNAG
jgi:GntR family transcriptional regulator